MEKKNEISTITYRICAISFICVVLMLTVMHIINRDKEYSDMEKTRLTDVNNIVDSIKYGSSRVDTVEDYLSDQFPGRDMIVKWNAYIDKAVGKTKFGDVFLCDNGYMMQDFMEPDPNNIDETCLKIKEFAEKYKDSDFYMMLVPNSVSVYKEYLPEYAVTGNQDLFIDGVYNSLDGINCLDVRQIFSDNKKNTALYYYTDHHWTSDAAYLAYGLMREKMGYISEMNYESGVICNTFVGTLAARSGYFPKQKDSIKVYRDKNEDKVFYTVSYEDEKKLEGTCYRMDRISGDNPYELFFGGNHSSIEIKTSADTNRTLLVIKDSYANCLIPFLINDYSTIKVIDPRYYSEKLDILMETGSYSDVLFLYNANTFSQDTSLKTTL